MIRRASTPQLFLVTFTLFLTVFGSRQAKAQSSTPSDDPHAVQASPSSASTTAQAPPDDAAALDLAEPDFTVVNIPTTLRLPVHKGTFHLTHRFNGNLRSGSFTDQLSNLFGIDQGATVGFEYRFGVMRNLQAAAYRSTFDRTIQLYGKYDGLHQSAPGAQGGSVLSKLVSISGLVSIEGSDNFQERFQPALGAVVSREIGDRLALYAAPIWVHNSAAAVDIDRDTFYVGLAARARIRPTIYLTGEFSPRASGYAPGQSEYGFGVEARVGAHVFQLTFTNTSGTTFGQIARGGNPDALYLGFNLTRKFF